MDKSYTFYVPNLFCGGCSRRLTQGLMLELTKQKLEEKDIICDPVQQRVTIKTQSNPSLSGDLIKLSLERIGFPAHQVSIDKTLKACEQRGFLKRLFVAGLGTMQVMMFSLTTYMQSDMSEAWMLSFHWFSLWVTSGVLMYAGKPFFLSALEAAMRKKVNMDVPIVIALILAYVYSCWSLWHKYAIVYFDSINMFLFFITLGRFLEWRARHRAQSANDALQEMIPNQVQKLTHQGSIVWVDIKALATDDHIMVAHGEIIPADMVLLSQETSVDESLLTGESKPITRQKGQLVYAGTLNLGPTIEGNVQHISEQTKLGQIQQLLTQAQARRPRLALWADKVAGYFVLALLIFSGLTASYWYLLEPSQVIPITISVLIVTCPCALSLATPAALATALGQLAKHGIVLSRSDALEKLLSVNHFVFDKTGTLTEGKFGLTGIHALSEMPEDQLLSLAAAMEQGETHPIAKAFRAWQKPQWSVSDKSLVPGLGIGAVIDGTQYWLGAAQSIQKKCPHLPPPPPSPTPDATNIYLATRERWLALFSLSDQLKPNASHLITELSHKHHISLLSGDQPQTVAAIADQLNIKQFQAQCLPEDKQSYISALQAQGQNVAMVGDGANDSPVLALANVGIAMGSGTALAQASADIILLNPNLMTIQTLCHIAKRTHQIIRQNMLWALGYNALALPFAAMGWVPAWLAAIGMSLSSLVVVSNSLRLRAPIDKTFLSQKAQATDHAAGWNPS